MATELPIIIWIGSIGIILGIIYFGAVYILRIDIGKSIRESMSTKVSFNPRDSQIRNQLYEVEPTVNRFIRVDTGSGMIEAPFNSFAFTGGKLVHLDGEGNPVVGAVALDDIYLPETEILKAMRGDLDLTFHVGNRHVYKKLNDQIKLQQIEMSNLKAERDQLFDQNKQYMMKMGEMMKSFRGAIRSRDRPEFRGLGSRLEEPFDESI